MAEILETLMLVAFGISWPINAVKSYRARSTKGKSLTFLILIFSGYICGIISKLINPAYMSSLSTKWYVLAVYIFNFVWVGTDLCLYFRNRKIEKAEAAA
ncbi:MAG: hypothetical protein IJL78_03770 [Lachnospiraceae bacterium]|nr:hypothetical protein [Lachnospiraceae bacterium]